MLYSDELIPQRPKDGPKLGYKLDIPQSYEYYKNKTNKNQPDLKSNNESFTNLAAD